MQAEDELSRLLKAMLGGELTGIKDQTSQY